ncbi:coiled-coil domain-containing protein 136 isoform X2 [Nematolebias whitei]|uniref:coiled-coil domain-containing protein 136 isoform X2 n=1 Tax=Nematolebias whitei TaxID=451745 RepID=UPI0018984043|nr:coiled-coil domain-containing protein 136 isoform X2 [Nematolebias whitei]
MDGLRLPPVIEEVLDPSDELCELQEEKPTMLSQTLTAWDRKSLEEKKETAREGEKGQQEEEKEVKDGCSEEEEQEGVKDEEEELEELRSQVVQLLLELEELREVSQRHEENFMELQGLLEEERLASAHQAESFTRQIQNLQAQLHSVQEEMNILEEEKENELEEVQQELRLAQEEVLILQQAAEETAAERENDIASLQEELCRLKAELQRLHSTTAEYELEVNTLRAEMILKSLNADKRGEETQLHDEFVSLTDEHQTLSSNNRQLSNKVEQLQQQDDVCDDAYLAVRVQGDTEPDEQVKTDPYITLSQPGPEEEELDPSLVQDEIKILKVQLKQAAETAQKVQKECEGLKAEFDELQNLYEQSQQERAVLELELQRCKNELYNLLGGTAKQSYSEGWNLVVAAVAVAAIAALVVPSFIRT